MSDPASIGSRSIRPTRTRIKVCGIRDVGTALVAASAGTDAIGLVFVEGSPRRVDVETARQIVSALPPFVEPVGLFVDRPPSEVRTVCERVGLRTVQLHGGEGPGYIADLAPLRVVKALRADAIDDPSARSIWFGSNPASRSPAAPLPPNLMAYLLDAPPPAPATPASSGAPASAKPLTGGSGETFDWPKTAGILREQPNLLQGLPLIVAGGLTAMNVASAIAHFHPYAVDVSSGVESSRGLKSAELIAAFCQAVNLVKME